MRHFVCARQSGLLTGTLLASAMAFGLAGAAHAGSDALKKMESMQVTGTPLEIPLVPQSGAKADQIRKNLEGIKLPPGFKIDLFAVVPDARHMAVGRSVGAVWVGTRKSKLWVVWDRDRDRGRDRDRDRVRDRV